MKKLNEIGKRPGMSVKEFALGEVGKKLLQKDIPGMIKEADLYVDPTIMNRLAVEEEESYHHTQHSFDAVADLKRDAGKSPRIGASTATNRRSMTVLPVAMTHFILQTCMILTLSGRLAMGSSPMVGTLP